MRSRVLEHSRCDGKKIAILGDMYELGEDSDRQHFGVGLFAGGLKIDTLIAIGTHARKICEGADGGNPQTAYYEKKEDFYQDKDRFIENGDIILVKGSRKEMRNGTGLSRKYFETVGVVMKYISIGIIMLISFIISVVVTKVEIPVLKRKAGQNIREDGPQSHLSKAGTPSMGGIAIIIAASLTTIGAAVMGRDRWPWMCHHTPGICRHRTNRFL